MSSKVIKYQNIIELNLEGNCLGAVNLIPIIESLEVQQDLSTLNLSNNSIGKQDNMLFWI